MTPAAREGVSVVVPVAGPAPPLQRVMEALRGQSLSPREVILAVGPDAGDSAARSWEGLQVRLIRPDRARRYGGLAAAGLRAAKGRVAVLLAPWCVPSGGDWLETLVRHLDRGEVGAVVSQCVPADRPGGVSALLDPPWSVNRKRQPERISRLSGLADAMLVDRLGDLEEVWDYCEPAALAVDLSVRLAEAGAEGVRSEAAVVEHWPVPDEAKEGLLRAAVRLGREDAAVEKASGGRWLNGAVMAGAWVAALAAVGGVVGLPYGMIVSLALFVWGWFLSLRMPLLGWEVPVAGWNFLVYVAVILAVRRDWSPWLFGRQVHPAIIRQWCWLASMVVSYGLVALWRACIAAGRASKWCGWTRAVGLIPRAALSWLAVGLGYLAGRLLPAGRRAREDIKAGGGGARQPG